MCKNIIDLLKQKYFKRTVFINFVYIFIQFTNITSRKIFKNKMTYTLILRTALLLCKYFVKYQECQMLAIQNFLLGTVFQ